MDSTIRHFLSFHIIVGIPNFNGNSSGRGASDCSWIYCSGWQIPDIAIFNQNRDCFLTKLLMGESAGFLGVAWKVWKQKLHNVTQHPHLSFGTLVNLGEFNNFLGNPAFLL
ncbi:MAG TPA: hypothetical protein V6D35_22480 [Candidatus Sericytochromatia bacterium]|jgi:hypothetical protein